MFQTHIHFILNHFILKADNCLPVDIDCRLIKDDFSLMSASHAEHIAFLAAEHAAFMADSDFTVIGAPGEPESLASAIGAAMAIGGFDVSQPFQYPDPPGEMPDNIMDT